MTYDAPFAGLKVVDLSGGVAGPAAAMMLAQQGAEVIKVESPFRGGDWARGLGIRYGDHTAFSVVTTLGKRNIALDLKAAEGREVVWRLLRGADVLIEGFKPGTVARYGLDYEAVRQREPQIIYYSVSGFGQRGPLAGRPAMDPVLQSFIGVANENRGETDGYPRRVTISLIDQYCGLLGLQAIMAALYARREIGTGRYIELSLMQAGAMLAATRMIAGYLEQDNPRAMTTLPNGVIEMADGEMNVTMVQPGDWGPFCEAIEQPELAADPRYADTPSRVANMATLMAHLRQSLKGRERRWLGERLAARGLMHAPVNTYSSFLREEQVTATDAIAWLDHAGLPCATPMPNLPGLPPFEPGQPRAHAAIPGEDTRAVLLEHGYSPDAIDELVRNRIVFQAHSEVAHSMAAE